MQNTFTVRLANALTGDPFTTNPALAAPFRAMCEGLRAEGFGEAPETAPLTGKTSDLADAFNDALPLDRFGNEIGRDYGVLEHGANRFRLVTDSRAHAETDALMYSRDTGTVHEVVKRETDAVIAAFVNGKPCQSLHSPEVTKLRFVRATVVSHDTAPVDTDPFPTGASEADRLAWGARHGLHDPVSGWTNINFARSFED